MNLKVFNTLKREKEDFVPLSKRSIGMYHCGPTVYHYAHIGNLRAYVFADTIRRFFEYHNIPVKQVINITDVGHLVTDADEGEDKMEKGARREGKSAHEIAQFYEKAFMDDLAALNIRTHGTIFPRASEHINEQIALIKTLEQKGVTYRTSDGIYFDTSKIADYGKLDPHNASGIKEGMRVEQNKEKKHATDFALWKFSRADEQREQEWDTPWGKGFPGWHLECSAMSMKYLGETFDIHTGGVDHIQIHHTNEIAQSETATGKPFSRYFMHVAFVNVEDGKMSKSEDNFVRLATLSEKGIHPLAYRYALLTAHYRSQLLFSYDALHAAQNALSSLAVYYFQNKFTTGISDKEYLEKIGAFLADDFNTPKALALLWKLIKDSTVPPENKIATIQQFDTILGLGLTEHAEELEQRFVSKLIRLDSLPQNIQELIADREKARKNKDWKTADVLRQQITEQGFSIKDSEQGPQIEKIP